MGVGTKNNPNYDPYANLPKQVDYSPILPALSENQKVVDLAQVQSQIFSIQQVNLDREMQFAMNTQLGVAKLDEHLSEIKLDYMQRMSALENRHQEKMAASTGDIPSPATDD
ncbi:MAG TPA: hypothetical protein VFX30_07515 [bacterium]|nr:hypothetical protein [bacterium]